MRTILITGATGFLGQSLVKTLLMDENLYIIAMCGRSENKSKLLPKNSRVNVILIEDFFKQYLYDIDTVINCAFARSNNVELLVQSLDFTEKFIKHLKKINAKSVINISTQGVYKRLSAGLLSREDSPIEPIDFYSMSKYVSEKLFLISSISYITNVRLASLMMPQRFLYSFVKKVMDKEPFTITAPNRYEALMDVSDAASGLATLVSLAPELRSELYNLGIGVQYSLMDYACSVKEIGGRFGYDVSFNVEDGGDATCAGMDCDKFMKDTGWKPKVMKDEMITNIFKSNLLKTFL